MRSLMLNRLRRSTTGREREKQKWLKNSAAIVAAASDAAAADTELADAAIDAESTPGKMAHHGFSAKNKR